MRIGEQMVPSTITKTLQLLLTAGTFIFLFGCTRSAPPPSEAEKQASALIDANFRVSQEDWFAAVKGIGAQKPQLVQFHHPWTALVDKSVSDTDRMNGISERHILVFDFNQSRSWEGHWSDWQPGASGGAKSLTIYLPGGAFGYWTIMLEKRNGAWHMRNLNPIHELVPDKALLDAMMRQAGG